MASVNKVILVGNLGADPEKRFLGSGAAVTNFRIATSERWNDKQGNKQEEVNFFSLVAYGKRAEVLGKFGTKGKLLYVDGRLNARTVTNDKGESRTWHDVRVDGFRFLDRAANPEVDEE